MIVRMRVGCEIGSLVDGVLLKRAASVTEDGCSHRNHPDWDSRLLRELVESGDFPAEHLYRR